MELKDYLKLEKRIIPSRYIGAIYEKLKMEMAAELVLGGQSFTSEDLNEIVRKYNDKWNAIREEYGRIFGSIPVFMPENLFKDRYESELVTEESLRNTDYFCLSNKDLQEMGDDIYETE